MTKKNNEDRSKTSHSFLSFVLVGAQGVCVILLAVTGGLWPDSWGIRGVFCVGIVVGIWALYVMGVGNVRVFPEVPTNGRLVIRGPYRWVRHPMYTSVLLVTLAWTLDNPLTFRIGMWIGLLAILFVKLQYEERLLMERFPEYIAYHHKTKRLLPFIW